MDQSSEPMDLEQPLDELGNSQNSLHPNSSPLPISPDNFHNSQNLQDSPNITSMFNALMTAITDLKRTTSAPSSR
jgi:hypothetical protein